MCVIQNLLDAPACQGQRVNGFVTRWGCCWWCVPVRICFASFVLFSPLGSKIPQRKWIWHHHDAINTAGIDVHKQMPLKNCSIKISILWAQCISCSQLVLSLGARIEGFFFFFLMWDFLRASPVTAQRCKPAEDLHGLY